MLAALTQQDWDKLSIYVARPDFQTQLLKELKGVKAQAGNLVAASAGQMPVFARDIWYHPCISTICSIGDAVKQLKTCQPFWYVHPLVYARRSKLIAQQLPYYKKLEPQHFPLQPLPNIGAFTLLDKNLLLYAVQRDKPVPDGIFNFAEDRVHPPNRAYLKLWEALCLLGRYPQPGDFALDLGAAPGGWSYVLHTCGARVWAIDKAPLDQKIVRLPGIRPYQQSAFALKPENFEQLDWLVGDIACYPGRLYHWLQPWLNGSQVRQFVLTLKLQGDTDFEMIRLFQQIPGSRVLQLSHNKHEVTWFYPWYDRLS